MISSSRSKTFWAALALSAALLAACSAGSGKSALRPEAQQRAASLLERALRAQQKGQSGQAEQLLRESLASSSSIEDNPARIVALVNLARLNRLRGDNPAAAEFADQALLLCSRQPELFMAEVAYEKAHIELALDRHDQALIWATRALDAEGEALKGVRRNLLARAQMAAGDGNAAARSAREALGENRKNAQAAEEANSLRLLGTLAADNDDLESADALFLEALGIDKRIGASARIGLDLEKLADVAEKRRDLKLAADYLERAGSVYRSAGNSAKATGVLQKLEALYRQNGNTIQAEKARQQREQLPCGQPPCPASAAESANPSSKP